MNRYANAGPREPINYVAAFTDRNGRGVTMKFHASSATLAKDHARQVARSYDFAFVSVRALLVHERLNAEGGKFEWEPTKP